MITVTQSIQTLVEAGAYIWDNQSVCRDDCPEEFDTVAGKLVGTLLAEQYPDEYSPRMMARVIERYCGRSFLKAYLATLRGAGIYITRKQAEMFEPIMDIGETAKSGKKLGWNSKWCPFAGEAAQVWRKVFAGKNA